VTLPAVKSLLVRARIGLVESIEARDTACPEIRADLTLAHDRGVRASGKARRHMRDCDGCRHYRTALRATQNGFGALTPGAGPLAVIAKLLGIGGAGSGAAAGSGAMAAGGGTVAIGGGAAVTASKVAAIVASAAVVSGGAVEVREHIAEPAKPKAAPAQVTAPARSAPAPIVAMPASRAEPALRAPKRERAAEHHAHRTAASAPALDRHPELPGVVPAAVAPEVRATGGAMAPDEDPVSAEQPAAPEKPSNIVTDLLRPKPEADSAKTGAAPASGTAPATHHEPDSSAPASGSGGATSAGGAGAPPG
jgi:hypothetical protein